VVQQHGNGHFLGRVRPEPVVKRPDAKCAKSSVPLYLGTCYRYILTTGSIPPLINLSQYWTFIWIKIHCSSLEEPKDLKNTSSQLPFFLTDAIASKRRSFSLFFTTTGYRKPCWPKSSRPSGSLCLTESAEVH
jgi:hypothetical protein